MTSSRGVLNRIRVSSDRVMDSLGNDAAIADQVAVGAIVYHGAIPSGGPFQEGDFPFHKSRLVLKFGVRELCP